MQYEIVQTIGGGFGVREPGLLESIAKRLTRSKSLPAIQI